MSKKNKSGNRPGDRLIGALLLTVLYGAALALRPLIAPWEYDFAATLHQVFPAYPFQAVLLRLPAAAATLLTALLVGGAAITFHLHRPWHCAALFLLLPPVFLAGTSAAAVPFLTFGCAMGLFGLLGALANRTPTFRLLAALASAAGIVLTVLFVRTPFFNWSAAIWAVMPLLALIVAEGFERFERSDKARAGLLLDRASRIFSCALAALALMVILPALLRHFKISFPEELASYQPGEHLYRPMLTLLIPLLWLHLSRHAEKIGRKLLFAGVAVAFLLLTLPLTLPWNRLRDYMPEYLFRGLNRDWKAESVVGFADARCASVLKESFHCEVRVVGNSAGEVPPEKFSAAVQEALKKSDVLCLFYGNASDAFRPKLAGTRYVSGKFRLYRYFGEKKK